MHKSVTITLQRRRGEGRGEERIERENPRLWLKMEPAPWEWSGGVGVEPDPAGGEWTWWWEYRKGRQRWRWFRREWAERKGLGGGYWWEVWTAVEGGEWEPIRGRADGAGRGNKENGQFRWRAWDYWWRGGR